MSAVQIADRESHGDESLSPTRILRLGAMVEALLVEVRHMTLDQSARMLLADIHRRSVEALSGALPSDLANELADLVPNLNSEVPSPAALRVAQAQLHGWLSGLLQGIQVASVSQHLDAQRQLSELREATERQRTERAKRQTEAAYR